MAPSGLYAIRVKHGVERREAQHSASRSARALTSARTAPVQGGSEGPPLPSWRLPALHPFRRKEKGTGVARAVKQQGRRSFVQTMNLSHAVKTQEL